MNTIIALHNGAIVAFKDVCFKFTRMWH